MLTIKNLTYEVDGKKIIDNLSCEFQLNKFHTIIGENGCGKTSLSKIMTNLLVEDQGLILLNGNTLQKSDCSLIFQNPQDQFIFKYVLEDLAFSLENINFPSAEIKNEIEKEALKLQIGDLLTEKISNLSGGQQQKVATTSMLLLNSKIIICDESTTMLDPSSKFSYLKSLRVLVKYFDTTVISITHDMDEAYFSDQITVMKSGQVVKQENPVKLFSEDFHVVEDFAEKPFLLHLSEKLKLTNKLRNKSELEDFLCQL